MKYYHKILVLLLLFSLVEWLPAAGPLKVVATLTTYADIARKIGGDRVEVQAIVAGDQDAHFVRPKPSYALMLRSADLFVTTGLDLELWVPALLDMARNPAIRSGQPGYVAAYDGIELLDKPSTLSRAEGDLHIYGNPHISTNPLNFKIIAGNIAIGLEKLQPADGDYFRENLARFREEIDRRVFGDELVRLMGGDLLTRLAQSGRLMDFLKEKNFDGKPLLDYLGGWLHQAQTLRGQKIVAYHKNWSYFRQLFGLDIIGYVEPKPGIPPSPRHVESLIGEMKHQRVHVVLAANYFDENKVRKICRSVSAAPVIVPLYVDGAPGSTDVFQLVDLWVNQLVQAIRHNEAKSVPAEKGASR